jgi:hypothetical protein
MNIGLAVVSKSTSIRSAMRKPPPFAPDSIQKKIVAALKDRDRWFIAAADTTTRSYLDLWTLSEELLVEELVTDLERYRLYQKPAQPGSPGGPQKYQYVLPFPEEEGLPALHIHVTLSPRGEPPTVKLSVHPHNIPGKPLPCVPLN